MADRETSATREQALEAAKALARAERERAGQGAPSFLKCTQKCTQIGFCAISDLAQKRKKRPCRSCLLQANGVGSAGLLGTPGLVYS